MAGVFNDAPSNRMAWDIDGTVVLWVGQTNLDHGNPPANTIPSKPWLSTSLSQRQTANNEDASTYSMGASGNWAWAATAFVFPEDRELDGWYENVRDTTDAWESYSQDTTNAVDGTWNTATVTATQTTTQDHYRDNIDSLAINGVKGLIAVDGDDAANRFAGKRRIHLYGNISPAQTPDRILFLDTENADAVFTKVLDFGDIPRDQTQTRTFKVKNNSGSLTINTVEIIAEDLYLNAGDWYEFGDDGVSFQATFPVGNLGPSAEKLLYLKQIIPDGETLGPQVARIVASHASVS